MGLVSRKNMGKNDDFDKDLGDYLSGRKKKKIDVFGVIKGFMPKPTPPPVKLPPEVELYDEEAEKKPEVNLEKTRIIEETEEKTLDNEITGQKKSIWHSLIGRFKFKPYKKELESKDKQLEQEEEGRIQEMVAKELMLKDLRDTAKIALYLIKQLSPERLREFKQSSDFSDLKEILKKYNFIK
jgi:hypothetical protein